jgi:peptidoglycan hydrolase-like protein with peptidoglycan-binding domain
MVLRKAISMGLALCAAAGLCLCAVAAQNAATKKPAAHATSTSASGKGKAKKTSRKKKDKGQQAPTKDRITEIQTALSRDGSYKGDPNGKWDDTSVSAMKSFQSAHGLNPSGKLDARSLEKLGLGSQTAGAGAPIMPPHATSRLTSSVAQAQRE